VGLEPTSPHDGCGVLAAERPVLLVQADQSMGPEGLEPSPTWLRARHAAANTLIPVPNLSGAGRGRTLACQIKSLLCCPYTTTPQLAVDLFVSMLAVHCRLLQKAKSLGVESNHRSRLIRTMCSRYTTKRRAAVYSVGTVGIEPTHSCAQDTRATGALHPELPQWPVWESNPSHRLERAVSSEPIDERAVRAQFLRQWVGRRSNPRPLVFSQVLHRLSYRPLRPKTKKPDVALTPGLKLVCWMVGRASQAQWMGGGIPCERKISLGGITRTRAFLD
jgi:hypothetical protein